MKKEDMISFNEVDELTQDMAQELTCPFTQHYCRGKWCMAWRVHKNVSPMKGYCKLIEK